MLDAKWLLNRLMQHFPNMAEQKFCLAYSGGIDSTVLLHLMASLQHEFASLRVVHVNHGLSPNANQWEEQALTVTRHLNLPCVIARVAEKPPAFESVEAFARRERYRLIADMLQPDEWLVTAQHQDDQAETLLLQLLRGAGPTGLSAMPELGMLNGSLPVFRPMLECTRKDVEVYAADYQLQWVEDESNADDMFDRNYLRHHVMPLLKARWPATSRVMARSARHCADTVTLLDSFVANDYQEIQTALQYRQQEDTLRVEPLLTMEGGRLRLLLRHWIARNGYAMPSEVKLRHIISDVVQARQDSVPHLQWGNTELRKYRNFLYLTEQQEQTALAEQMVDTDAWHHVRQHAGTTAISLCDDVDETLQVTWVASTEPRFGLVSDTLLNAEQPLRVVYRTGWPSSRVSEYMRQANILPWCRDRVPLLVLGEELVAIGDTWVDPAWRSNGDGFALEWRPAGRVMARAHAEPLMQGIFV